MQKLEGRILFIGENEEICQLISKILKRAGCEPLTASSRAEALRIIPQEHPDSILIDWVSEGDGEAELCKEVRALAPEASVYLFTGVATGQEVKLGMLALQGERIESLSVDDFVDALFEDSKTMCGRPRGVPAQNRDVVH